MSSTASLTGAYLSGRRKIDVPRNRRQSGNKYITIKGARQRNDGTVDWVITCTANYSA